MLTLTVRNRSNNKADENIPIPTYLTLSPGENPQFIKRHRACEFHYIYPMKPPHHHCYTYQGDSKYEDLENQFAVVAAGHDSNCSERRRCPRHRRRRDRRRSRPRRLWTGKQRDVLANGRGNRRRDQRVRQRHT